jgi:gliding motility-associated-like protein
MKLLLLAFSLFISLVSYRCFSQTMVGNSAVISINTGAIVYCNGGIEIKNTQFSNNGDLTITKNSTFPSAGNFQIENASVCQGNGIYSVEQDWINDAVFNANASTVKLFGNTEQLISSTNGTSTTFNNLQLTGNGTALNRRKTLTNVDVLISTTGVLDLGNRELNGNTHNLSVLNPSSTAITGSLAMNDEGFISNTTNGFASWVTNSTDSYVFPVGSSDGTQRFRPVVISPNSGDVSHYAVRFNNYVADNDAYPIASKESTIDQINNAFYHSIELISGESNVDLAIAYLSSIDGEFVGMANWSSPTNLWKNMDGALASTIGNYAAIQNNNWTLTDIPYILTTLGEDFQIPNVFTPNNDGINDTYFVTSKGIKEFSMFIVNRWGDVVFSSEDVNEKWDGMYKGKLCSDGVYFYKINAKSATKEYNKQGFITLTAK